MDHAFSKQWHGIGPIASTHPASPIPLLHRWLPDRFCLNNQPAIHTSCTSKVSLCGWPALLLLLSSLEADGLRRQAHSETCSARESRLETYTELLLIPIPSTVMLSSNPVDVAGLPLLDEESGTESRKFCPTMPHLSLTLSYNHVMLRDLEHGHSVR